MLVPDSGDAIPQGDFIRDTQVTAHPERPHVYCGEVPPAWMYMFAPGAVLVAQATRAAKQELARAELRLLSAQATFCAPVPLGPVEIVVRVLRSSKTAAQVLAELSVPGQSGVCMVLTVTFARGHQDSPFEYQKRVFPADVAPPGAGPDTIVLPEYLRPMLASFTAHAQYESRRAVGHLGWEPGWVGGAGRYCGWTRLNTPAVDNEGLVDPLSLIFVADAPSVPISQALGPELGMNLMVPTLNMDFQVVQPSRSEWHCFELRADECVAGYVHVTGEIWDEDKRLVALCNQRSLARPWMK